MILSGTKIYDNDEKMIPYYRLLQAIFNSDSLTNNKYCHEVILYDNNDDLPVGVFRNTTSCANFLGLKKGSVHSMRSLGVNIKGKYRVESVDGNE